MVTHDPIGLNTVVTPRKIDVFGVGVGGSRFLSKLASSIYSQDSETHDNHNGSVPDIREVDDMSPLSNHKTAYHPFNEERLQLLRLIDNASLELGKN